MLKRIDDARGYAAEIDVHVPAAKLFDAISTVHGLKGWWMGDAGGSTRVGDEFTVIWGPEANIVARVEDAKAPVAVRWKCVAKAPEVEWVGTEMTFDIAEGLNGSSRLVFRHVGLKPSLECWARCEAGWDFLLPKLVDYAAKN